MIDLASGNVLVFNGEIYNYRDLRAELAAAGVAITSSGDTEVLLKAYCLWGDALWPRLDGIFALLLFDAARGRLVLARDHAGIKPLYYARTADGGWIMASQVRAIIESGLWGSARLNLAAIGDYLRLGSIQEPGTIVNGVLALPAGTYAEIDLMAEQTPQPRVTHYWIPEREAAQLSGLSRGEISEHHRALLQATVNEQLASDVPVGFYLSGGIDSTVLLSCVAGTGAQDRISAFTVGGALTVDDETTIAATVAGKLGVRHTAVHLAQHEVSEWMHDGLHAMDQPSCDGMNTYIVSRASKAAVMTVALGGTGADEVHGAYGHAAEMARLIRAMELCGPLGPPTVAAFCALMHQVRGRLMAERLELLFREVPATWRMIEERRRFFTPTQIRSLWPIHDGMSESRNAPWCDFASWDRLAVFDKVRLAEIRGYLLNTLLRDSDWATMANQQEYRVPYLGRRYLEFVLGMPRESFSSGWRHTKPALVAVLGDEIRQNVQRKKTGFNLDYRTMLLGPLREVAMHAAETLNTALGFTLDMSRELSALQTSGSAKQARRVWALMALGAWISRHRATL
jgi:asparagine synthase (glutamine-hydrolysing)